eukprot:gb/GECH01001509.1/.p1 GENE.gb/GECH01001509.1/~~gb/GECH01001509.1/.p1  ORF type:complete len:254 (+),score=71.19 gb/GECH01001509.1/:1-762(+)
MSATEINQKPSLEDDESDSDMELDEKELLAYLEMKKGNKNQSSFSSLSDQKTMVRDQDALSEAVKRVRSNLDPLPWLDTLSIVGTRPMVDEAQDDLEREVAFYKGAAESAAAGQERLEKGGVPFWRPDDYFAEMVKADGHMQRIKKKLVRQKSAIEAREDARMRKEQRRFGKKLQNIREQEKHRRKNAHLSAVSNWRRSRKPGEEFDVDAVLGAADNAARLPGPGKQRGNKNKKQTQQKRPGKRRRLERLQKK